MAVGVLYAEIGKTGVLQQPLQLSGAILAAFGAGQHQHRIGGRGDRPRSVIGDQHLVQIDSTARGQRLERAAEQLSVGLQVPVMNNVGHEDRVVTLWPSLSEHVDRHGVDPLAEACFGDVFLGQLAHGRQLHDRGAEARVALGQRNGEATRAAAHVEQPGHALEVAVPGDANGGGHGVAVHEGGDRPRHLRRQLAALPGLDGTPGVVDQLGLQSGDEALGVHVLTMEAEGVPPIEGAVMQQVKPRRFGRLVAAQMDFQEAQGGQHREDALQGVEVEAGALGELLGRSRAARVERLEQMHLIGCGHRRHPVGREPDVPHHPVVPNRILDVPCNHAPLRLFQRTVDHAPPIRAV